MGVISTIGADAAQQSLNAVTNSKYSNNASAQLNNRFLIEEGILSVRHLIKNNPLCGRDAQRHDPLVFHEPANGIYRDSLEQNMVDCGMLLIHETYGTGKSSIVHMVARGRCTTQPERFLVVSTGSFCESGDTWFDSVRKNLQLPKATPEELAEILTGALSSSVRTDDSFRLDVKGLPDYSAVYGSLDGPKAVLVLEDLNPQPLEDRPHVYWLYDEFNQHVHRVDRDLMGESFKFLKQLAQLCAVGNILVLVTTKLPRVGRVLHDCVNGGSKCKLAPSLMYPNIKKVYNAETFIYYKHYRGFDWTVEEKMGVLCAMFPILLLLDENEENKLVKCAKELTLRDLFEKAKPYASKMHKTHPEWSRELIEEEVKKKKKKKKGYLGAAEDLLMWK